MSNRTTLPRRYLPEGCFPAVSVEAALQHVFPGRGRPPPTGSPLPVALIDVDDMSFQENAGHVKRMYEKAMRDRQHQFIDEQEDFVRRSAQRWVNTINEFADASSTADAPPEVQAVDGAQENVPDVPMTSQLIGKIVLVLSDSPRVRYSVDSICLAPFSSLRLSSFSSSLLLQLCLTNTRVSVFSFNSFYCFQAGAELLLDDPGVFIAEKMKRLLVAAICKCRASVSFPV